jgi:hypothetical protein
VTTVRTVFEFDPSEHYKASRIVTRFTAARWIGWGFAAFAAAFALYTVAQGWDEASPAALIIAVLPWLLLGAFWIGLIPLSQRWAARTIATKDASVRGPQERSVDAVGYHSRGNGVGLDVPWHAMVRGVETEAFFLFFYNKQCAYYLPKRAVPADDVPLVRSLMRAGLGERAQVLG